MPTVVYKKPDTLSGALEAATGFLQGRAAAEGERRKRAVEDRDFAEQQLQFRVSEQDQNAARQDALQENARQFDVNQRFARDHEELMRREGILTRQQQTQTQQRDIADKQFEQKRALDESNLENRRDNATRRYDIKKRSEAQADDRAIVRAQSLMGQKNDLEFAQRIRGELGDPTIAPYTPAQWDTIYQQAYDRYLGPGTTTGAPDVPQATKEQKATVRKQVEQSILGYDQARAKLISDTSTEAESLAKIEATYRPPSQGGQGGRNTKYGVNQPGGWKMEEMFDSNPTNTDPLSGQRELSDQFMRHLSTDQAASLDAMNSRIASMVAELGGHDKATAYQIEEQVERDIENAFSGDEWQGQAPSTIKALKDTMTTRAALAWNNTVNPSDPLPDETTGNGD